MVLARLCLFFMSSCIEQTRAALVKWWGVLATSPFRQGGSHGHYSRQSATQATETFPTPAPPTTQSAAAYSAAASPIGGASTVGRALSPPSFRRGLHPPDLSPILRPAARGCSDHRQSHDPK